MTIVINVDCETRSHNNLKAHGAAVYSEDGTTECMCWSYRINGGELLTYDFRKPWTRPYFLDHMASGIYRFTAWNIQFERNILKNVLKVNPGSVRHWSDTMAIARQNCLPGALGDCGRAMRLDESEMKSGTGDSLINYLSKPYKGEFRFTDEKMDGMVTYCEQDVMAESAIDDYLSGMSPFERRVWELDQVINERGIPIDVPNATIAVDMFRTVKANIKEKLCELCGVDNPGSGPQMKDFFDSEGLHLPNLQAPTIDAIKDMPDLSDTVKEMLPLYQAYKRSPITKYQGMIDRASSDGRMRGAMLYHGAATGRWSSIGINTQNLPRPSIDNANDLIKYFGKKSIEAIAELAYKQKTNADGTKYKKYGTDVVSVLASAIRGMIKAPKGKRFLVVDYDQIEARVIAWLAQEPLLIQAFIDGKDPYVVQAAAMFNLDESEIGKDSEERFLGKIAILALGFGGGVGAFLSMARAYGREDITEAGANRIVKAFREANPNITQLWDDIDAAAQSAVRRKGKVFNVGKHGFMKMRCTPVAPYCLESRLPSGRVIKYWYPKIGTGKFDQPVVVHEGTDSKTRQWKEQDAWYGKLTENAVQGIAADYLREALINLEAEDYYTVLHVHDEVITEMPEGVGSVEEMSAIMCRQPDWFKGCPIAASGEEMTRYSK